MKIGTYYYPEQWPREQWERDFDNIAQMGLQIVHMGEFAWFSMEPKEGDIQLDWLSNCVEMAAKRKLDVILCTPTAVSPIWLVQKHPEVLLEDEHGTPARVGGRRHYSPTSPALHEATTRIVTALVDRFGHHPAVSGWQIDNEYSGPFGQNDHTHAAFRQWLQRRYETIENLNKSWGTQFWNTQYTDWSQVMFPQRPELSYDNPHQRLDASRFWSWAYAHFNKLQAEIIKEGTKRRSEEATKGKKLRAQHSALSTPFITTNFMSLHPDVNPADFAPDLTLFSWDCYPVTGWVQNPKDETYRLADPEQIGFMHDWMGSLNGRLGMLEVQPGQVNWSGVPVLPYPGAIRLWLWTALAHGAEFTTVYRFRQPRFGTELWHAGLVGLDGITPSPGGREFMQTIEEVRRLEPAKLGTGPADVTGEAEVGLMFDHADLWYYATLPHAKRWDQRKWLLSWYSALARMGWRVRILRPGSVIDPKLKMLVVPGMEMADADLIARWAEYTNGGGQLLLTCRTGIMDRTGQFFEGPYGKLILPLIGGTIDAYDSLPAGHFGKLTMDDKSYDWGVWGDLLYADEEAKVIAKYSDQFYTGGAAAMTHRVGQGGVTYCGVHAEQPFVDALVERIAAAAKIPASKLPNRVHILRRGPYRILLNYQDKTVTAPAAKNATFVIGQRKVEPAGVAVWEEA